MVQSNVGARRIDEWAMRARQRFAFVASALGVPETADGAFLHIRGHDTCLDRTPSLRLPVVGGSLPEAQIAVNHLASVVKRHVRKRGGILPQDRPVSSLLTGGLGDLK